MKKIKKISRKAFTLIELLLVIAVIAILAGTIMVSGSKSVISAEANNIINNMRILKTAALEWLADYGDYVDHGNPPASFFIDPYAVTYPYTYVAGKGGSNPDLRNHGLAHIQNVMISDEHGRQTVLKYIKTLYKNKEELPISINEGGNDKPYAKEGGYAIVDASGSFNNGGDVENTWPGGCSKWYVVYQFEAENNHVKKLKQRIANIAEEYGLLKNNKDNKGEFYTEGVNYVYMEIADLSKIFRK